MLEKAEEQESRGVVGWSGVSASILSSLCASCSHTQLLVSLLVLVLDSDYVLVLLELEVLVDLQVVICSSIKVLL